jgi:hypothetical protein
MINSDQAGHSELYVTQQFSGDWENDFTPEETDAGPQEFHSRQQSAGMLRYI